jgi:predicted RNA-binding protein YlqC (UPF0109 family)
LEESNLQEILRDIVTAIIGEEAEINITEKNSGNGMIVLELSVASENMGKVIGKKGRIAKALRTVMKACANKRNQKVVVEIV